MPGATRFAPPLSVAAFEFSENHLLVGGTFSLAGGAVANGMAGWDGTNWMVFEHGVTRSVVSPPSVSALALHPEGLCVAGHFKFAGRMPASDFSVWRFPPRLRIARRDEVMHLSWPEADYGYALEASDQVWPEPSWQVLSNAPVVQGGQHTVIDASPRPQRFYRLTK